MLADGEQPLDHRHPARQMDRTDLYRPQRRCTHRNEPGVRRHVRAAQKAGATRDEILDTLKGVSVLGIHSVAVSLPILFEEATDARAQPAPHPIDTTPTPVIDQLKAGGLFNPAWDAIYS